MKTIITDNMRLHLSKHDDVDILWINGLSKFFINKKSAFIINELIDNFDITNGHTLQNQKLIDIVVGNAAIYFKCDEDLARIYTWFVVDNIIKFPRLLSPHQLLLSGENWEYLGSPTRMDLAVTYRCNNRCYFCYADCPKVGKELNANEWKIIIDKISLLDVTTLYFSGGEPTLRDDLVELMLYSSDRFYLGIITNGRLLSDNLCGKLKHAGMSYAQITIHSHDELIHDDMSGHKGAWADTVNGIKSGLASGIYIATNTTLMRNNYLDIAELVQFLYDVGVRKICFNSLLISGKGKLLQRDDNRLTHEELRSALKTIKIVASHLDGLQVEWLGPTCYNRLNPIELGFGTKNCAACVNNMTIEPDGRVIPCQSWIHEGCGNMIIDGWDTIWNSDVAQKNKLSHCINECKDCKWSDICKGACPLDRKWVEDLVIEQIWAR